jgi:hypothetical protein
MKKLLRRINYSQIFQVVMCLFFSFIFPNKKAEISFLNFRITEILRVTFEGHKYWAIKNNTKEHNFVLTFAERGNPYNLYLNGIKIIKGDSIRLSFDKNALISEKNLQSLSFILYPRDSFTEPRILLNGINIDLLNQEKAQRGFYMGIFFLMLALALILLYLRKENETYFLK